MKQENKVRSAVNELMEELKTSMEETEQNSGSLDTIAQLNATTSVALQSLQTIQLARLADTMEDIHERLIDITKNLQQLR